MKRFRFMLVAVVAMGALALTVGSAIAGRVGGSTMFMGSVAAHHSAYYNVAFLADNPAFVWVQNDPGTSVELFVYDADGHVTGGVRYGTYTAARVNVYREGWFRIEVRNVGSETANFVLKTN